MGGREEGRKGGRKGGKEGGKEGGREVRGGGERERCNKNEIGSEDNVAQMCFP